MLKNTFCHLSGITPNKEQKLWGKGICSWEALLQDESSRRGRRAQKVAEQVKMSLEYLAGNNPIYFAEQLPSSQHWRLFPEFRDSLVYLDIETTGLGAGNSITTIALYDGKEVFTYVQGQNLDDFVRDINKYKLIVTYNGKSFDVPFIESYFGIKLPHAHIDLRFVLKSLGYTGGLKACEKQTGISREELDGVDGYTAVLLWNEYKRNKNPKALETLLAYNILDVLNLEKLLIIAYNQHLDATPFNRSHKLVMPREPKNPYEPDERTLKKVLYGRF